MTGPQTPPKTNLKRGAFIVSVLLLVTFAVAQATGQRGLGTGTAVAKPPPKPAVAKNGTVTLSAKLDRTRVMRNADGTLRMKLTLRGEERAPDAQGSVPTDLIVVLDRSGSMGGEKLARAKSAAQELIEQLGESDRFSLVTYESGVRLEIPLSSASASNRGRWRAIVDSIQTAGGTNMSAGMDLAHQHLMGHRAPNRTSRVILISDGQANEGDATTHGLSRRATKAARSEYVLSTVGVGLGFNEELMTTLANVGTGNFYFVDQNVTLAGVFKDEFESARETVASGLAVHIRPPAGVVVEDAAGYVLEHIGGDTIFRPGTLFAGQTRTIWVRYRVPTDGTNDIRLGDVRALFTDRGDRFETRLESLPLIACVSDENQFYAGIDKDVWASGIAVDELNAVRQKVSSALQRGDKEAARRELDLYRDQSAVMNRTLNSPQVTQSLQEAAALQEDLADAFTGPGSEHRRNIMSKKLKTRGFDGRRLGAKK